MTKEYFILRTILKHQERGVDGDAMNSGAELGYNIINLHT